MYMYIHIYIYICVYVCIDTYIHICTICIDMYDIWYDSFNICCLGMLVNIQMYIYIDIYIYTHMLNGIISSYDL